MKGTSGDDRKLQQEIRITGSKGFPNNAIKYIDKTGKIPTTQKNILLFLKTFFIYLNVFHNYQRLCPNKLRAQGIIIMKFTQVLKIKLIK